MILDSLILENFGAYGGRQEACLSPSPEKPIILFGGLNGGGKTTLLDALQLAIYGSRAKTSNRGRQGYKDYLQHSIHRGCTPDEGASLSLHFRRITDGITHHYQLNRSWRLNEKGIQESLQILCDGQPDPLSTDHWDEIADAYLPSKIAHLFFFDGEQIKDLAEGQNTAEIIGSAIHSLLGLDVVERLESDLFLFERRKRSEDQRDESNQMLFQMQNELHSLEEELERLAQSEGSLMNQVGRLAKDVHVKEEEFQSEGGDLFMKRQQLEAELHSHITYKKKVETELRDLSAGPLPLLMLEAQLSRVEQQIRKEATVKQSKIFLEAITQRDTQILETLHQTMPDKYLFESLTRALEEDRKNRESISTEPLILNAPDELAHQVDHLKESILPDANAQALNKLKDLTLVEEKIARFENDLSRVPDEDRIQSAIKALDTARSVHAAKLSEVNLLQQEKSVLQRQIEILKSRLQNLTTQLCDSRQENDDRQRMLKHSNKARLTLQQFRSRIVEAHAEKLQSLMLESFQRLLRKKSLVSGLKIDPKTFETTLTGKNGTPLPFDRLSAGERQLLATAMLWGLARATGRPIPTVIDTPLGRLDSHHRSNLIKRYFPHASHQVLLLSTDEEIAGEYYEEIRPYIARTYLLNHDEHTGMTKIVEGYFS